MSLLRADNSDEAPRGAGRNNEMRRGWRHQDAVALIRKMIMIGEFAPGERLREESISQKLGMSRTPVREAFLTLAAERLVERLPNRSVVVSEFNKEEVQDVFLVLGALEALAAEQACERMTEEQIGILGELQDQLERFFGQRDRENYVETNQKIHELIVESSHNGPLISAWRLVLPRAARARNANNIDRNRWTEAVYEHRRIFTALKARDPQQVAQLMNEHFANGSARYKDAAADAAKRENPGHSAQE